MVTLANLMDNAPSNKTSVIIPGGPNIKYQDLRNEIEKIAGLIAGYGVNKGSAVSIVLENTLDFMVDFLAVTRAGAIAAPLNPAYTVDEFKFFMEDADAKLVIVSDGATAAIEAANSLSIPFLISSVNSDGKVVLSHEDNDLSKSIDPENPSPDDIALFLHTSGTTSKPKMVPLTHLNLSTSAKNIVQTLNLDRSDKCINIMPLFHIHGIVGLLLSSLCSGGSIFTSTGFNALKFFSWLKVFSPTWYSAVPTMHQVILSRADRNSEIIAMIKLRFIRASSAPLPSATMKEIEKTFNCPVIESYGMTEASHQMTSNHLPPGNRKAMKVGFAAGPEVSVMDGAHNILEKEKIGEIVIKGNNVTKGYLNNFQANKDSFVDGWFRTGDQGFYDEEGFLQITGRIKEIINKGGEKISPLEIDDAIMKHESVFQGITFPIVHNKLGEEVAAAVVLKDDHQLTEQALKEFLSKILASYKIPQTIVFLEEIPKGKTGKLQRIGLAKKLGLEK